MAFQRGVWVLLSVAGLIAIKAVIAAACARLFGTPWPVALRIGLLLSEAGELAFVVIGQATLAEGLTSVEVGQFMVVVAGLSMVLTPLLAWTARRLEDRLSPLEPAPSPSMHDAAQLHDHIVIAGFGRVRRAVAGVLRSQAVPFIALDSSADQVRVQCKTWSLFLLATL